MLNSFLAVMDVLLIIMWVAVDDSIRWHQKNPEASRRMAEDHARQDRLEGRY